jgi:hypothetical protein
MVFRETVAVYSKNHMEPHTLCGQNAEFYVKEGGIYIYIYIVSTGLSSSPIIIRMIKSRMMRWTGHAARMGEERNAYRILVGTA